jgi:signal transduction histidine kinase
MLADGLLALLVCLDTYIRVLHSGPPLAQAALLIGTLCLIARRVMPGTVLALSTLSLVVYAEADGVFIPLPLGVLIALYTVAARYPPWVSLGAVCVASLAIAVAIAITASTTEEDVYDRLPLVAAAWLGGYCARLARERAALMEQQTAQLKRAQETRTRLAVIEEQARIARELHDIVAHHLTVIVAQATAAERIRSVRAPRAVHAATARDGQADVTGPASDPASAPRSEDEVLRTISASGREALGELRRLLGALRPGDEPPGTAPWPGLGQVHGLIDQVERSGLPVELIVRGVPRPLPVSVELSAYRIIQEALTNALKHAGPAKAEVELDYQADQLALRISDDGAGGRAAAPTPGYGLLGMVQRAAMLGGKINVGPVRGGSFQVTALLPVSEG